MNAIEINGLSKRYGRVQALDGISFSVSKGEIFGLVGPDGAGKSTLFRILTTLMDPDSGNATVDGLDVATCWRDIRRRVGYMPGRFSLYQDLSVEENLSFFASLFGVRVRDNYDLIAPVYAQIEPFRTRRAGKLSGGMKQKLALSCALVHAPSVLFLDEPTTGVDAVSRGEFWAMLKGLQARGISILVSTPYMDEAGLCDRVALVDKGRILGIDTPQALVDRFEAPLYAVSAPEMYPLLQRARTFPGVEDCYTAGDVHHLVAGPDFSPEAFSEAAGCRIERIRPNIEDTFFRLMKPWTTPS